VFADHVRRCFHCLRRLPSIRRTLTTDTATALVNALAVVICRTDYSNAVLTGVYGVHMRQLQGVLNAAACLIVRKRKFDSISSMIRDVLHWLPIQHRYSTACKASHPSTCRPCANQSLRISTDTVYVRLHVEICHKNSALRSPQLCCGWTVYMELFAGVAARPVINPNIFLLPTQYLSFQQSMLQHARDC